MIFAPIASAAEYILHYIKLNKINSLIFAVDLWREAVIELEYKQHNFRGKKDEK